MFNGYLRSGDVEVINTERLQAYVDNGIAPQGLTIDTQAPCDGLGELTGGDDAYTTPVADLPPWYDPTNQDTVDFAGVLPLEIVGLDTTTRTVQVDPTLEGSGLPSRALRSPRVIAVSALLVGRTTAGVQAGLAWLQGVLSGPADDPLDGCGTTTTLSGLTSCPTPVGRVGNPDSPRVVTLYNPLTKPEQGGRWRWTNATFDDPDGGWQMDPDGDFANYLPSTRLVPIAKDVAAIDARTIQEAPDDTVQGGGAQPLPDAFYGGGARYQDEATVAGDLYGCSPWPLSIDWRVQAPIEDGRRVRDRPFQLGLFDAAGLLVERGPEFVIDQQNDWVDVTWDLPLGVSLDEWRPGLITRDVITIGYVRVNTLNTEFPDDCVDPYRRFFPNVACTSGPTITSRIDADCAELLQVEWVWTAGSPYRYGITTPLIAGLTNNDAEPPLVAEGVSFYNVTDVVSAEPWDCDPPALTSSYVTDPGQTGLGDPPGLPVIVDPDFATLTTQQVRQVWVLLDGDAVPDGDGVMVVTLATEGLPVIGARVRVWDDANPNGSVPDLCDFAYEWLIDYIPAGATMTLDGVTGKASVRYDFTDVDLDPGPAVKGTFGGPLPRPVVGFGKRYLVRVQWLDVFPRTTVGLYQQGDVNGPLTVGVSVAKRDG